MTEDKQPVGVAEAVATLRDTIDGLTPVLHEFAAVAAKTKLLGFNASIVAAQAGSEGRSFAVVAEQMKSLNQRATVATGLLSAQVDALQRGARRLDLALHPPRPEVDAASDPADATDEASPED